ncbi:OmpA family protein [Campylobacter sp. CX2-8023-23]|uniref:OmpA family protein n=1 Tax=Campylobacter porcelli TaxID=1660073 RepID=UPI002EC9E427|nr:OmpA family protein [Campylobacter sp. CX2-8023-23]
MKKIVLALCAASALFATDKYELTIVGGYAHPEGTQGIDDQKLIGLRLGRNLDLSWLSQIELGFDYTPKATFEDQNGKPVGYDTRIARYFVNLVKDFALTDRFSIYALAGAGYQDLSREANDAGDDGFGQAGLGFKFKVVDNFSLKLEARDAINFKDGDNTFLYTLGFASSFGSSSKAEPIATPVAPTQPNLVDGDDDNDGVLNSKDRCPNTPAGAVVDENGCEKVIRLNLNLHANFASDSATLTPEYIAKIDEVAKVLNANQEYKVILEGHTDSTGSQEYNQKLSERRANAVAAELIKMGVSKDRIQTIGYGELSPIATNKTKEGRAQNRRVDAKFRN